MTCFTNFHLIDGRSEAVLENAWMLVENGKITEIGQGPAPVGEHVSLEGRYVMPGLIECHTHMTSYALPGFSCMTGNDTEKVVFALKSMQAWLEDGVTYIRDVGSFAGNNPEYSLRKLKAAGLIEGPNFKTAGKMITMTGGHGTGFTGGRVADGVEEVRKATRELIRDGADLIKTVTTGGAATKGNNVNAYQYNVDELTAIVTEAHKAGKKVAAHSHGAQGIKNGLIAGVDTIEHGTMLDDEGVRLMVEKGAWLVPTFAICKYVMTPGAPIPPYMVEAEKQLEPYHAGGFKKAYEAGVKIAAGTDLPAGTVRHALAKELSYMVEASGMSNFEAIQAGTKNGAELIGVEDEYGTLEVGKYADFIVLDGNPLTDLTETERPVHVYQHGVQKK